MTFEERQAEIARLRTVHAAALATGTIGGGTISGFQVAKMSGRSRRAWEARVDEAFRVEAQIRELSKTDEQIAAEEAAKVAKQRSNAIDSHRRDIKLWLDMGKGAKGKIRPSYQKMIDRARAELTKLGATEEP